MMMTPRDVACRARYFVLSLYFLYNSQLLMKKKNAVFQYLRFFNYGVLLLELMFQLPAIGVGCHSSLAHICFSWQAALGTTKYSAVHPTTTAPSPFDVNRGLWASIALFVMALFQSQVYADPKYSYIRRYYRHTRQASGASRLAFRIGGCLDAYAVLLRGRPTPQAGRETAAGRVPPRAGAGGPGTGGDREPLEAHSAKGVHVGSDDGTANQRRQRHACA